MDRFHRFHFDRDRVRFAIAHGNMRRILGAYLKQPPAGLRFKINPFGKPELIVAAPGIHFNLSHSHSIAVLAVSSGVEVGIDVEDIRPIEPEVARSSFSPAELSALNRLEGDQWLRGFYHCWTRKEAILKAEGVGLNFPLDAFDVSLVPGAPAELLATRPHLTLRCLWKLHDVSPAEGTAGALAAGSPHAEVACFRLA
jgi:4'-phosphopantetheinyl transferase